MHSYVVEYLNENEFHKKERSLKKYNMLAYKKLIFSCVPELRNGNFQGVITNRSSFFKGTWRYCSSLYGL